MPRFVVLERSDSAAADAVAIELAGGEAISHGWQSPAVRRGVCVGAVSNFEDAAQAVLAALAGASLVIEARAPREVIDQLCDDLRRIGSVDHRVAPPARPSLGSEERALLAQLLTGMTLGEAARTLHISRRTADRRLAAARGALNAGTTPEALRRAAEIGIKPAPPAR